MKQRQVQQYAFSTEKDLWWNRRQTKP